MILEGNKIRLRALEPEDLSFLFQIENNDSFWEVSHTQVPFSRFLLKQYLENAHVDIYEAKQLRLMMETLEGVSVGMIDLFDFNPQHHRAGVGLLVAPEFQKQGYASEALKLLINYAFSVLNLHQLYANILTDNIKSIALFEKCRFIKIGVKKDWVFSNGTYKDEFSYQLIKKK